MELILVVAKFIWIILGCWCLGIFIGVERLMKYTKYDIDRRSLMSNNRKQVIKNKVQDASQSCSQSSAFLAFVFKNELKRANQPKDQIQDLLEASILEVVHSWLTKCVEKMVNEIEEKLDETHRSFKYKKIRSCFGESCINEK